MMLAMAEKSLAIEPYPSATAGIYMKENTKRTNSRQFLCLVKQE
jgi:hypothetical protein